jgi:uncharacterized tellurite resistance protein B-like protein
VRIKKIEPSWDGSYPPPRQRFEPEPDANEGKPTHRRDPFDFGLGIGLAGAEAGQAGRQTSAVQQIGRPTPAHVQYARQLIASMPVTLTAQARSATGAQAVLLSLLLDRRDPEVRQRQLEMLQESLPEAVVSRVQQIADDAVNLKPEARLPLADLAMPVLVRMDQATRSQLLERIDQLSRADQKRDLFEWAIGAIVERQLSPATPQRAGRASRPVGDIRQLKTSVEVLLGALAKIDNRSEEQSSRAFDAAARQIGLQLARPTTPLSYKSMSEAMDHLSHAQPLVQRQVIQACATCIEADGAVTTQEAELMRVIAETLGVPMPPLLPGQKLAG